MQQLRNALRYTLRYVTLRYVLRYVAQDQGKSEYNSIKNSPVVFVSPLSASLLIDIYNTDFQSSTTMRQ